EYNILPATHTSAPAAFLVYHNNHLSPGRPFYVQLRDFPRGPVIFRGISRGTSVPSVILQVSILEAREAPSIFVTTLIRGADGTHPLRRQVGELLEEVVINGTLAHDTHHPTHGTSEPSDRI